MEHWTRGLEGLCQMGQREEAPTLEEQLQRLHLEGQPRVRGAWGDVQGTAGARGGWGGT